MALSNAGNDNQVFFFFKSFSRKMRRKQNKRVIRAAEKGFPLAEALGHEDNMK